MPLLSRRSLSLAALAAGALILGILLGPSSGRHAAVAEPAPPLSGGARRRRLVLGNPPGPGLGPPRRRSRARAPLRPGRAGRPRRLAVQLQGAGRSPQLLGHVVRLLPRGDAGARGPLSAP